MKKFILLIAVCLVFPQFSITQSQAGFKYQAVIRDASGSILINQDVGLRMTVLKGSTVGTEVYSETFSNATNSFGLVNLEIGRGNVIAGLFSNIDWSEGPFFLEVAMDVEGGTNYVVMGTSELLSVPYALHAREAENVFSGDYSDLDNAPTNLSAFNNDQNFISIEVDGDPTNELIIGASLNGTKLELTDAGGTTSVDLSSLSSVETTYSIGEMAHGGIVFWVDDTGHHGLVVSIQNLSFDPLTNKSYTKGDGVGAGYRNTTLNIAVGYALSPVNYAWDPSNSLYYLCADYMAGNYGDWYLPSKYELNLIYTNLREPGLVDFSNFFYWSSTEADDTMAWAQQFSGGPDGGEQVAGNTFNFVAHVRAVRAF